MSGLFVAAAALVILALLALLYRYLARRFGSPLCSICGAAIESDSPAQYDMGVCERCLGKGLRRED
jgi:hypothetical protein